MSNYSIAISGLRASQRALDVIGNNIANAASDGYHRQRIALSPAYSSQVGTVFIGGGVDVNGTTRLVDKLLEQEFYRQQSLLEQVAQEYSTLRMVENVLGEFSDTGGLNKSIDNFFNALDDLAAHPAEIVWQNQAVSAAQSMTSQFKTIGNYLTGLERQIELELGHLVDEVNVLTTHIGRLNDDIEKIEVNGSQANNLRDQRDQCILELSKYLSVQTIERESGVTDVFAGGLPTVIGASVNTMEFTAIDDNTFGIGILGSYTSANNIEGGRMGGMLSLRNTLLKQIHDNFDTLAIGMIDQLNRYHFQGVGSTGSFTSMTGWPMNVSDLSDIASVTDGTIYIRVTDTSTGEVTRNAIAVDVSEDSLADIAADINAITGISAFVSPSGLHIEQSSTNYKFDFLPGVLPAPTATDLGGSPPAIAVSGIYNGTVNQTYEFTVNGTGSVGNGTLQFDVKIKDGDGTVLTTLNIGENYAAGDMIEVCDGIKISLSAGNLSNGNNFEVQALDNSDTSGLLIACGMNTLFSGTNASDFDVCDSIVQDPGNLATVLGNDLNDNANALKLADLRNEQLSSLSNMSPGDYYRNIVTDLGQDVLIRQMRSGNLEAVIQNLSSQQSEISGVDINQEAAELLIYEQMFQAMAKYMNTIRDSMETLMNIL